MLASRGGGTEGDDVGGGMTHVSLKTILYFLRFLKIAFNYYFVKIKHDFEMA